MKICLFVAFCVLWSHIDAGALALTLSTSQHRHALQEESRRLRRTLQAMGPRLPDGGARIRRRLEAIEEELQALDVPSLSVSGLGRDERTVVDLCSSDMEHTGEKESASQAPDDIIDMTQTARVTAAAGTGDEGISNNESTADQTGALLGRQNACNSVEHTSVYDHAGVAHTVILPAHNLTQQAAALCVLDRLGREVVALQDTDAWHSDVRDLAELELDYKHWKR